MQIPKRRSQMLQIREDDGPVYVTPEALQRFKDQLMRLETERPQLVEELSFARQKGDLSENAEYQDARAKLSRMDSRIFSLKEKIKNAALIPQGPSADGRIQIGTTVVLSNNGKTKTYTIVGTQESNPAQGRISHVSPLGKALLNERVGSDVDIETPGGTVTYRVESIS